MNLDHLGTCDGVERPALAVAGAGDIPVNILSFIMIIKVIILVINNIGHISS